MIPKIERVDVPEWEGTYFVRRWNVAQRARVFEAVRAAETPDQLALANIDTVIWSTCDAGGKLLFSEADRPRLADADAWAIDRIADAARALNMPEKKSPSTPSGCSDSGSPAISA